MRVRFLWLAVSFGVSEAEEIASAVLLSSSVFSTERYIIHEKPRSDENRSDFF